jgi:hypothetical protein
MTIHAVIAAFNSLPAPFRVIMVVLFVVWLAVLVELWRTRERG